MFMKLSILRVLFFFTLISLLNGCAYSYKKHFFDSGAVAMVLKEDDYVELVLFRREVKALSNSVKIMLPSELKYVNHDIFEQLGPASSKIKVFIEKEKVGSDIQSVFILFSSVLQSLDLPFTKVYFVTPTHEYSWFEHRIDRLSNGPIYLPMNYEDNKNKIIKTLAFIVHELYHLVYKAEEKIDVNKPHIHALMEEYDAHRYTECFSYWASVTDAKREDKYTPNKIGKKYMGLKDELLYSVLGSYMVIDHLRQLGEPYCDIIFPAGSVKEQIKKRLLKVNNGSSS
jgi:hypothetical protein